MNEHRHGISGAFVFLLLGVFAVFSTVIVLLGAQLYQSIREQTEFHNDRRVLNSYIVNAVHANDSANTVEIRSENGTEMLIFGWDIDGDVYETRIYCHNGLLYELFCSADDEFKPEYGEVICAIRGFSPCMEGNLVKIRTVDATGDEYTLHVAMHSEQEGAE